MTSHNPNYKVGAIKRKVKVKDDWQPGQLITEMNKIKSNKNLTRKEKVSIMGLV